MNADGGVNQRCDSDVGSDRLAGTMWMLTLFSGVANRALAECAIGARSVVLRFGAEVGVHGFRVEGGVAGIGQVL